MLLKFMFTGCANIIAIIFIIRVLIIIYRIIPIQKETIWENDYITSLTNTNFVFGEARNMYKIPQSP